MKNNTHQRLKVLLILVESDKGGIAELKGDSLAACDEPKTKPNLRGKKSSTGRASPNI